MTHNLTRNLTLSLTLNLTLNRITNMIPTMIPNTIPTMIPNMILNLIVNMILNLRMILNLIPHRLPKILMCLVLQFHQDWGYCPFGIKLLLSEYWDHRFHLHLYDNLYHLKAPKHTLHDHLFDTDFLILKVHYRPFWFYLLSDINSIFVNF